MSLIDPHAGSALCAHALDKAANASGQRRLGGVTREPPAASSPAGGELPPLLRKLLADYAATSRPRLSSRPHRVRV